MVARFDAVPPMQGIQFPRQAVAAARAFEAALDTWGLADHVQGDEIGDHRRYTVTPAFRDTYAPGLDTTRLCERLGLAPNARPADREREILLALLLSPEPFIYPSFEELQSGVSLRARLAHNAARTRLAFDTEQAERPPFWTYEEATGFTLDPAVSLIDALLETTQPTDPDVRYSFSCYRATEYVLLLSIAQELAECHPAAYAAMQRQWQVRAILSSEFHDVFLREYGLNTSLPFHYYVPGDRLWFRNPDGVSSDAEGYEGSWVFYLGNGLFANFWKLDQPYTIDDKCLEIYHWRHGTYRGADGKLRVDDDEVDRRVALSAADPVERQAIIDRMMRLRDPAGVYADGGCIDRTRECVRLLRPGTGELVFPDAAIASATA